LSFSLGRSVGLSFGLDFCIACIELAPERHPLSGAYPSRA
jgi:hypothetical protein